MYDVVALGELLIDFVRKNADEEMTFCANAGGAPCNALCQLSKLGKSTAFIGKVGNDMFGRYLKAELERYGISTKSLVLSDTEFTTLAFVDLDSDGNRSFSFSRKNSADVMLSEDEVDESLIKTAKIFHCGTLSLTDESSKKATLKALKIAKENGVLICTDPNLRLPLWSDEQQAMAAFKTVFEYADIVKISDDELEFFTGLDDTKKGAEKLLSEYKIQLLFVTRGKDGAYAFCNGFCVCDVGMKTLKPVDTTGAGDSFCGAALSGIIDLNKPIEKITENELYEILHFAVLTAGLSTENYGAMPSMKTREEIERVKNGRKDF